MRRKEETREKGTGDFWGGFKFSSRYVKRHLKKTRAGFINFSPSGRKRKTFGNRTREESDKKGRDPSVRVEGVLVLL